MKITAATLLLTCVSNVLAGWHGKEPESEESEVPTTLLTTTVTEVVSQITDGQIQATTSTQVLTTTIVPSTIATVTKPSSVIQSSKVESSTPGTTVAPSTIQSAHVTTPVTHTNLVSQITDGQIQASNTPPVPPTNATTIIPHPSGAGARLVVVDAAPAILAVAAALLI
ncbi:hypothetical protein Kpol_1048p6 [Vanderwaltozyma polyspora DSM 70294]|uniref:Uncharacterized protein n=1 Tax=Vanderwaltozyma polyspora (strain ATCC 22028 / DSM 70294 / BCRC 21397 / CBS 2163 / NBRC 10782 / NRRL Y-8283 / UCD 57-17) TaxID=436907 RepID=A7TGG9_VANPO|nr:uncharacterized protein Kpol_1048p6 [Vanderwaltozyma polyspora DSM 70294]EDO18576.1 hypothetical protein Kpol_1048p6 [Vanderwaltozyma polyspora DSM 70294]